jgi:sugar fermentation stimulation protein A
MLPKGQILSSPMRTCSEPDAGLYLLVLRVVVPLTVNVGALGRIDFAPGYYIYCGSARRNLSKRLARHMTRNKRLHWHIDYLTSRKEVSVESARVFALDEVTECALNSRVRTLFNTEPVRGFGCSDCTCVTHLTYLGTGSPHMHFDSMFSNG